MKKWMGKLSLLLGLGLLAAPFLSGLYKIWLESWSMGDWLILYSFVYWPSYILGLILIALGIWKLMK